MQTMVQSVYYSSETLSKTPHFHGCHQIILVLRGDVDFIINGTCFSANEGDIAIFSSYENHSVHVKSAEYERYVLNIDTSVVNRKSPAYSLLTDRPSGFCNVINVSSHIEDVVGIFKRLVCEHGSEFLLADEMEQISVKQLLITIYRCTDVKFDNHYDEIVVDLKRQFENHCSEQYTLNTLAKQYHISTSALSHRFRSVTGTSVMGYLLSCRLAQAKRLLSDTNMSIGMIVDKCGFSDTSNFSRTFKKTIGTSPTNFRKKYKTMRTYD